MVMLLHLDCIRRNEWSRRTFRSLILHIMYYFVRHYQDRFGIHGQHPNGCYVSGYWYVRDVFTYAPVAHQVSFILYADATIAVAVLYSYI